MKNKMKIILLALVLGLTAGCQTTKEEIRIPDPIVIVAEPSKPANVTRPELPVDSLTEESTEEDIAKAYVASIKLLKLYGEQMEEALKPYIDAYEAWLKKQESEKKE